MKLEAVLFDLDGTLLDTSEQSRGGFVRPILVRGRPVHEVVGALRLQGVKTAVVTNAREARAELLLKRFDIVVDELIAYEHVLQRKPHPQPVEVALELLGQVPPERAIFVGDRWTDFAAAHSAGVMSVGVAWNNLQWEERASFAADVMIRSPERLLDTTSWEQRRYLAELACERKPLPDACHWGSYLLKDGSYAALGRYFPHENPRHEDHELSRALLQLKHRDEPAPFLADALAKFIAELKRRCRWVPELIMPVPPEPGESRNRFEAIMWHLENRHGIDGCLHDGLVRVKDVPGYKGMSARERRRAIDGAYETSPRYDFLGADCRVLLVDDVLTTGATLRECTFALGPQGRFDFRCVAFGVSQMTSQRPYDAPPSFIPSPNVHPYFWFPELRREPRPVTPWPQPRGQ